MKPLLKSASIGLVPLIVLGSFLPIIIPLLIVFVFFGLVMLGYADDPKYMTEEGRRRYYERLNQQPTRDRNTQVVLPQTDARAYYDQALKYVELCEGDENKIRTSYDEVIRSFKEAIRLNPDFYLAYFGLGGAYLNMGDNTTTTIQAAIQALKTGISLNATHAEPYFLLGLAYMKLSGLTEGNTEATPKTYWEIINIFQEGIKLRPDCGANVYVYIAGVYGVLSKISKDVSPKIFYEEMLKASKEALRIDPQSDKALASAGVAYLLMGDKEKAMAEYDSLKVLNPEMANELLQQIESSNVP